MAEIDYPFFEQFVNNDLARLGAGLHQALSDGEFPESQIEVPKDTTELAQTGYMTDPHYEGNAVLIEMGYGSADAGDTAIYAVIQHERTDLNHPNGGNAKYLEGPVLRGMGTIVARAVAASKSAP